MYFLFAEYLKVFICVSKKIDHPVSYIHPENQNIKLWCLPRADDERNVDTYTRRVERTVESLDAYLVLIPSTLNTELKYLLTCLKKLNGDQKPVYFVKTKIDSTISKKVKSTRPSNEVKRRVRENLLTEIQGLGLKRKPINLFLVNSKDPSSHDFSGLMQKITTDLPHGEIRTAWTISLRAWRGNAVAEEKFKIMEERVGKIAFNAAFCEQFQGNLNKQLPQVYTDELVLYAQCFRLRSEDIEQIGELKREEKDHVTNFIVNEVEKRSKDLHYALAGKKWKLSLEKVIAWQNTSVSRIVEENSFTKKNVSIFEHFLKEALLCAKDVSIRTMEKIASSV